MVTLLFKDEGQNDEDLVDLLNTTAWVMSPEIGAVSYKGSPTGAVLYQRHPLLLHLIDGHKVK